MLGKNLDAQFFDVPESSGAPANLDKPEQSKNYEQITENTTQIITASDNQQKLDTEIAELTFDDDAWEEQVVDEGEDVQSVEQNLETAADYAQKLKKKGRKNTTIIRELLTGNAKTALDTDTLHRLQQFATMLALPDVPAADQQVIENFVNHADLMDGESAKTAARNILDTDDVTPDTKNKLVDLFASFDAAETTEKTDTTQTSVKKSNEEKQEVHQEKQEVHQEKQDSNEKEKQGDVIKKNAAKYINDQLKQDVANTAIIDNLLAGVDGIDLDAELRTRLQQFAAMLALPDVPAADQQVIENFVNHADLMDGDSFTATAAAILKSDEVSIETKQSIASLPGAPRFEIKTGSDLKSALRSQESYRTKLVARTTQIEADLQQTAVALADLEQQLREAETAGDVQKINALRTQIEEMRDQQRDLEKAQHDTKKATERVSDDETDRACLQFRGLDITLDRKNGRSQMLIRDGGDRIALPMKLLFSPAAMRGSVDTFLVYRRLKRFGLEKLFFDPDVECSRGSPPTPGQRSTTAHLLATIGLTTPGEILSPQNTQLFESILKNLEIPPAADPSRALSLLPENVLKNGLLDRKEFARLLRTVRTYNAPLSILRSAGILAPEKSKS